MLDSLRRQWVRTPAPVQAELNEVRSDTLRLVLYVATAGYLIWHLINTVFWPVQRSAPVYATALIAVPVLVGTYILLSHSQLGATIFFIAGQYIAISWTVAISRTTNAAFLYAVLALVAAFVIHPLIGFAVVGAAAGTLALFTAMGSVVDPAEIWQSVILGVVGVVGAWAVTQHLSVALRWYADTYDRAEQRTREAEEHRAQLLQALKQLDIAYYRLGRANAALATAWKSAEEAERAKSELVVNVSHELRTPLNLIVGFSELLVADAESYGGEPLPAVYRGDANAIFRSAEHLLALVDDILDMAQAGVRKLPLKIEPTDLIGIVHEAADLVRDYITTKGAALKTEVPPGRVVVPCDRLRIRQVLLNLVTNAARFTDSGSIVVELVARKADVVLAVTDTGRGMPPEILRHIFEEYYHVDEQPPEQSSWHTGSGLGVPISKKLVELHGGQMWADSTLGVGTRFWFTLPLLQLQTETASRPPRFKMFAPDYSADPVLVLAGHDAIVERLIRRHLRGYRVVMAQNLTEAVDQAAALHASAIVADVGQQVDQIGSPVPIIQLPFPHMHQMTEAKRVADYLVKPVSRAVLLAAVDHLEQSVRKVLIVDDDTRTTRLLTRMLQSGKHRYTVVVAHDGAEALKSMRFNRPDLVLLDLVMPNLDGQHVLKTMAQDPDLAAILIIVVSARDPAEGDHMVKGSIVATKPEGYRLAELLGALEAILRSLDPPRAYLSAKVPMPGAS